MWALWPFWHMQQHVFFPNWVWQSFASRKKGTPRIIYFLFFPKRWHFKFQVQYPTENLQVETRVGVATKVAHSQGNHQDEETSMTFRCRATKSSAPYFIFSSLNHVFNKKENTYLKPQVEKMWILTGKSAGKKQTWIHTCCQSFAWLGNQITPTVLSAFTVSAQHARSNRKYQVWQTSVTAL